MRYTRRMSLGRSLRMLALLVLTVMLVLRVGPVCEARANAAMPGATVRAAMDGCEQPARKPVKNMASQSCIGGCIAVDPRSADPVVVAAIVSDPPVPSLHSALEDRSGGPAPPPSRMA